MGNSSKFKKFDHCDVTSTQNGQKGLKSDDFDIFDVAATPSPHPWTSIASGLEGFFQLLRKKGYFQKLKNNSFQHNFGNWLIPFWNQKCLKKTKYTTFLSLNNFWGFGTKSLFEQIRAKDTNVHILGMVGCFILIFSSNHEHIMANTIRDSKAELMSNWWEIRSN